MKYLKRLAKNKGYTLKSLADKIQVSQQTVYLWNRKNKIPHNKKHLIEFLLLDKEEDKTGAYNDSPSVEQAMPIVHDDAKGTELFPFAEQVKYMNDYILSAIVRKSDIPNFVRMSATKVPGFDNMQYTIRLHNKETGNYYTAYYTNIENWLDALRIIAERTPIITREEIVDEDRINY